VAGYVSGNTNPSLILPRLQSTSRRRTNGSGRVEIREPDSFGRQPINPRRLGEIVAVAPDILPAHVVNKNEYDVGAIGSIGSVWGKGAKEYKRRAQEDGSTVLHVF
jgi:hypothetical protein